jgi:hypothetical protein
MRKVTLEPAAKLEDIYRTVSTEPLMERAEFEAYYRGDLNRVRSGDQVAHLKMGLKRQFGALPFKQFLMGHSGVGKSTELTRLCNQVEDQFQAVRFSATTELDPGNFRPFDVLLLMMARLGEETVRVVGKKPSSELQAAILSWFEPATVTVTTQAQASAEGSAGIGL